MIQSQAKKKVGDLSWKLKLNGTEDNHILLNAIDLCNNRVVIKE